MNFHPFHMVSPSPWPILGSIFSFMFFSSMIFYFHLNESNYLLLNIFMINLIFFQWWRDIIRESLFLGEHSKLIQKGLKLGMILFIVSEIFFFFSFFWGFFHNFLAPDIFLGMMWPPYGILMFNPYHIPLLNTIILLSSGFSITLSHHALLNFNFKLSFFSLLLTLMLGIYFSCLQLFEYMNSNFSFNDSIFGSTFFLTTGFHGLHVLIGSTFLFINIIRINFFQLNLLNHLSFEFSAWYWHFVDVVWIFLFSFIYWWPF
uniref:cytochrome c oxidase subunit III n=1 Tax=Cosmolaelaps hrdyi TaxID=3126097 RepID=UPI0030E1E0FD